MNQTKIVVDFNDKDDYNRVRLSSPTTLDDIHKQGIELTTGMRVLLHVGVGGIWGTVEWSSEEGIWVAVPDIPLTHG